MLKVAFSGRNHKFMKGLKMILDALHDLPLRG
jgi:hypothetical protein